jgi:hypothetical protein
MDGMVALVKLSLVRTRVLGFGLPCLFRRAYLFLFWIVWPGCASRE